MLTPVTCRMGFIESADTTVANTSTQTEKDLYQTVSFQTKKTQTKRIKFERPKTVYAEIDFVTTAALQQLQQERKNETASQ